MKCPMLVTALTSAVLLAGAPVALRAQASCSSATGADFAGRASCTSPGTTLTGTMTVVRVGGLVLNAASTSVTPSGADYEAAEAGLGSLFGGPTFTARSNNTYNVTVQYPATFTAANSKLVEDVAYAVATPGMCSTSDAGYTPLTAGGATTTIVAGAASSAGTARQLCIKVKWRWDSDGPGSYTLPLTFRITAP